MKVGVDNDQCAGQAQCEEVWADFYTLDDDGYSNIGPAKDVPAGREDDAREGISVCPMSALYEVPETA
jgi:ferredoxin